MLFFVLLKYPTFLGLAVLIVKDGYLQRMQKYLASLLKTYAVLTNALLARPPQLEKNLKTEYKVTRKANHILAGI